MVFLRKDGSAYGSERGFYRETEGLDQVTQPIIYKAAISRDAIFENVMIDYEGNLYFEDDTLTSNGTWNYDARGHQSVHFKQYQFTAYQ